MYIGSFQKTTIPPPQRKLDVNPPTPFGCPNTLFSPLPLWMAEISSGGEVWILSGTTHSTSIFKRINGLGSYIMLLMSMNGFWKKEQMEEDAIITYWMVMRGLSLG